MLNQARPAYVITWAALARQRSTLTWQGMEKYKKYLSDFVESFIVVAAKIYIIQTKIHVISSQTF